MSPMWTGPSSKKEEPEKPTPPPSNPGPPTQPIYNPAPNYPYIYNTPSSPAPSNNPENPSNPNPSSPYYNPLPPGWGPVFRGGIPGFSVTNPVVPSSSIPNANISDPTGKQYGSNVNKFAYYGGGAVNRPPANPNSWNRIANADDAASDPTGARGKGLGVAGGGILNSPTYKGLGGMGIKAEAKASYDLAHDPVYHLDLQGNRMWNPKEATNPAIMPTNNEVKFNQTETINPQPKNMNSLYGTNIPQPGVMWAPVEAQIGWNEDGTIKYDKSKLFSILDPREGLQGDLTAAQQAGFNTVEEYQKAWEAELSKNLGTLPPQSATTTTTPANLSDPVAAVQPGDVKEGQRVWKDGGLTLEELNYLYSKTNTTEPGSAGYVWDMASKDTPKSVTQQQTYPYTDPLKGGTPQKVSGYYMAPNGKYYPIGANDFGMKYLNSLGKLQDFVGKATPKYNSGSGGYKRSTSGGSRSGGGGYSETGYNAFNQMINWTI